MLMYALIGLLFVLIGLTGFQFAYIFYFDRIDRERKKHVRTVEKRASRQAGRLERAEATIAKQNALLAIYEPSADRSKSADAEDESWAEVLDDA